MGLKQKAHVNAGRYQYVGPCETEGNRCRKGRMRRGYVITTPDFLACSTVPNGSTGVIKMAC